MDPQLATPEVTERYRWLPSLVWALPLAAVVIGTLLGIERWLMAGSHITVRFNHAEGIDAGETKVKYKNVDIGQVEEVILSPDRSSVEARIRLVQSASSFMVKDTHFWVVRPRIAMSGISGLGTLVSGTYIGVDAGRSAEKRNAFIGLETPPAITTDQNGRSFRLISENLGSLDIGSPVYFRRILVGQVVGYELAADGTSIALQIFIKHPYDQYVSAASRFWQASGINARLSTDSIDVHTESLTALIAGGIAFENAPYNKGALATPTDTRFYLAETREQAMKRGGGNILSAMLYFDYPVNGLEAGAPVDFFGMTFGEVRKVELKLQGGVPRFQAKVNIELYLDQLCGSVEVAKPLGKRCEAEHVKTALAALVKRGMRAQLRSTNPITNRSFIVLSVFPNEVKTRFDPSQHPLVLPTVQQPPADMMETFSRIAKKIDQVPLNEITQDIQSALKHLKETLHHTTGIAQQLRHQLVPQSAQVLAEGKRTIETAEKLLQQAAPLPSEMQQTLQEVRRAMRALSTLAEGLDRRPDLLLRGKAPAEPARPPG